MRRAFRSFSRNRARSSARAAVHAEERSVARAATHTPSDASLHHAASQGHPTMRSRIANVAAEHGGTAATGAAMGFGLWRLDTRIGEAGEAIGKAARWTAGVPLGVADYVGDHLPNPASLEQALDGMFHGANSIAEGFAGPAKQGVTIVVALGGMVLVYQTYRYFSR